nr:MAG: hypothetical protein CTY15_07465 [Methylocystis sp.]
MRAHGDDGLPARGVRALLRRSRDYLEDTAGGVAIVFSISVLPLLALAGAGFDFLTVSNLKSQLQAAADAGALRAARELRLARSGTYDLGPIAQSAARAVLQRSTQPLRAIDIKATLTDNNSAVQVNISALYEPRVLRVFYGNAIKIGVQSTARTKGFPICALGLDQTALGVATLYLESKAQVTAQFCAVQSNSKSPVGITALSSSKLTAGQICSAGGTLGIQASFSPLPQNDCPIVPDPLASRPPPPVGGCSRTNEVIDGGTVTLMPGTYCGGLKATNGAIVTLSPGEYVMKDGPLTVDGGATLNASNAGVYLTGVKATLQFAANSTIKMTAPVTGPLAGILFFEDRAATPYQTHKLTSNNAPLLLGTIYMPQGILVVDANSPVAQQSAFTIIVARRLMLMAGPNLVLNSDYGSTNVPAPGGLTPGYSYLTK